MGTHETEKHEKMTHNERAKTMPEGTVLREWATKGRKHVMRIVKTRTGFNAVEYTGGKSRGTRVRASYFEALDSALFAIAYAKCVDDIHYSEVTV